ncbi:MAG: glycosyltransferase, partial [Planctomycetes bacterium]|nr:glycosyltransferase [Planctomycetota bacterium]
MNFELTIRQGPGAGRAFAIVRGRTYTVGRGLSCDVLLVDKEASRAHCQIRATDSGVIVTDLQSLNGTIVNGEVITAKSLEGGETLRVGLTVLELTRTNDILRSPDGAAENRVARPAKTLQEPGDEALGEVVVETEQAPGARTTYNVVRIEKETTVQEFVAKHPKDSANKVIRWWQFFWYLGILLAMAYLLLWDWLHFLHVLHFLCAVYVVVAAYKLIIVLLSAFKRREITLSQGELLALDDEDLPIYTVLVPLYKEEAVAEKIVNAVNSLDYPQHKLDVKVLLEPDDRRTIETLRSADLPACVELIIVPDSKPKTKPKACNHGLTRARGEYLVIYDAEDRPDPDQLKKAVAAFRKTDGKTICLQAKLNYYNPRQNLLTRL